MLARLVGQGVVHVEAPARYRVYRLNREHVAVPHIEALTRVRDEIVDRIRSDVAGWTIAPIHAGLFGSFARGTAGSDSDVDMLLVRPKTLAEADEGTWLAQLDHLDRHIQAWTGNAAQIIDLTPATLSQMSTDADPLVDSWRADDIPVHGERILDLLRRLR